MSVGCLMRHRLFLPPVHFYCLPALSAYPAPRTILLPHPPAPLPRRGRGRPLFSYARGFAPCIPACAPDATRIRRTVDGIWRSACTRRCLLCLAPGEKIVSNAAVASATDSSISSRFSLTPWLPLPGRKLKLFMVVERVPSPTFRNVTASRSGSRGAGVTLPPETASPRNAVPLPA